MATERIRRDGERPPDEGETPTSDDDRLPPITAEDIAHAVDRLLAGRESGLYEHLRTSDLYVLGYLSQLGEEAYESVLRDPRQLPRLLVPTTPAH